MGDVVVGCPLHDSTHTKVVIISKAVSRVSVSKEYATTLNVSDPWGTENFSTSTGFLHFL